MKGDESLAIQVRRSADRAQFVLDGELDAATAPRLLAAFHRLGPSVSEVVVDAQRLTFVDSAGLRVLISGRELLVRSGGRLRLRHVPRALDRLLELTGLSEVLGVEDRLDHSDDDDRRVPAF